MATINPLYVVLGAVLAALIAGFFSFIGMVSSKENKISEFRQSWIDELRSEVATYVAALHEMVRLREREKELGLSDWLNLSSPVITRARESLTKIHLRLNQKHVAEDPKGMDAELFSAIRQSRLAFNGGDFEQAVRSVDEIREKAAPLLKEQWERVKRGEPTYRRVRLAAWIMILAGLTLLLATVSLLIFTK